MSHRPAPSLTSRIVAAFTAKRPTRHEERLIQTLLDHPGGTCASLSALHRWKPNAWDMQFGRMIAARAEHLITSPSGETASGLWILTTVQRGADDVLRYSMRPEAEEALAQIGFQKSKAT